MADLSKYGEVRTMQFDHSQYSQLQELNRALSEGWQLIDARVGQWASVHKDSDGKPVGMGQAQVFASSLANHGRRGTTTLSREAEQEE